MLELGALVIGEFHLRGHFRTDAGDISRAQQNAFSIHLSCAIELLAIGSNDEESRGLFIDPRSERLADL